MHVGKTRSDTAQIPTSTEMLISGSSAILAVQQIKVLLWHARRLPTALDRNDPNCAFW
jgi:hypothetical protein